MRKIVAAEFISLDGVVEAPNTWMPRYFNEELGAILAEHGGVGCVVAGRVTFQEMVPAWAHRTADPDPAAVHMSKPKFVVSTTLSNTDEWQNSTLIAGELAAELTKLKKQAGKTIFVIDSATLVRSLLTQHLLDELRLLMFPIVLGRGKRLFDGIGSELALQLVDSKTLKSEVVSLTYERVPSQGRGSWRSTTPEVCCCPSPGVF